MGKAAFHTSFCCPSRLRSVCCPSLACCAVRTLWKTVHNKICLRYCFLQCARSSFFGTTLIRGLLYQHAARQRSPSLNTLCLLDSSPVRDGFSEKPRIPVVAGIFDVPILVVLLLSNPNAVVHRACISGHGGFLGTTSLKVPTNAFRSGGFTNTGWSFCLFSGGPVEIRSLVSARRFRFEADYAGV